MKPQDQSLHLKDEPRPPHLKTICECDPPPMYRGAVFVTRPVVKVDYIANDSHNSAVQLEFTGMDMDGNEITVAIGLYLRDAAIVASVLPAALLNFVHHIGPESEASLLEESPRRDNVDSEGSWQ